ncbi:MAG: hypothetical protein AAFR44_12960 [Pseudomonadota bacterium]
MTGHVMKGAALSIQVTQSVEGHWRVDAVKIKSEIGRHSIFPNGFALSDLFDATLVRDIESCLGTLDMERRLLAKPDYVHSTGDLTLKGMWVHLGTGVDAALCAIVSFKELIGNAYTAIRKFAVETVPGALPAAPTEAERRVLDTVVLPVMNIADSLMRHITHLNIDRRFEPALAAVHDHCREILSQHSALSGPMPPDAPGQANTLSPPQSRAHSGAHSRAHSDAEAAAPAPSADAPARVLPLLLDQICHAPPKRPDPD